VTDLVALTAELIGIPSVSHHEEGITDWLEGHLRDAACLDVTRVGNNVVARTDLGRAQRLLIAGHTDTVPANGNEVPRVEGDAVYGLGASDMKSGLAVMLELARTTPEPAVDVTYVFYECEEVDARFNGMARLLAEAPELVTADAAVLAEPTGGRIEAGCQGTLRAEVTLLGERAHTARAWLGRNAIHRLAPLLAALASYEERVVEIDGCEFHEGLQAVFVEGGVAGNVVPDRAVLRVNHRFAPDRAPAEAERHVRDIVGEVDGFELVDLAPGAPPALNHPLLARLVAATGQPPRAKLGWTDVARMSAHGVPATNFGPGDPNLAHTAGEWVGRAALEATLVALRAVVTEPA
jgi:succinyl-diaminopimelate desuccinylase